MKLVIAEKPSVAKSISAVLGAKRRGDGFFDGNGYIVSWCFGHLAELVSADVYDAKYANWHMEDIPILPELWQYSVSKDKKQQFSVLRTLMHRDDVSEVINACDAGREGELIFRTVYMLAECNKPMKRLWISSMEDEAIRRGFAELHDGKDYDNLYASALCRSKADWLVGINATRLFSLMYHRTLNVGRVMSPTLALLVQREAEITSFVSEPFYTVTLDFGDFCAESDHFKQQMDALIVTDACRGKLVAVRSVIRKERNEKSPALYDLTTLQRDANRLLGYTAQQTLDYTQSLYEKKLCTYPRTDSRFLTDDMLPSVDNLTRISANVCGVAAPPVVLPAQVCDSTKVSDHHAIVPTPSAGKADIAALPLGEREVMKLISRRVLCAACPPFRYAETKVALECSDTMFAASGKTVLDRGWQAYSEQEQKDNPLTELHEGQSLCQKEISMKEGKTTPPKHFTEDTLLSAMEVAGAKELPNDAERKGLGTPATRAGVLEKLVSTGFAERKKGKKAATFIPAQTGVSLITVLPEQLKSPLLTAEWEHKLKEIERGELLPEKFIAEISDMVRELAKSCKPVPNAGVLFPSDREVIGKCPRCGGDVTESKKGYFCENRNCKFGMWRDNKFFTAKKATLSKKIAASFLKNGRATVTGLYSEKTGKSYDATVVLADDGKRVGYTLEFGNGCISSHE